MTIALIQSPNTLYRSEIGADGGGGMRQLTPYEIVTELAYTYTGTTPSDALLTMAGSGNLGRRHRAWRGAMLATDAGKQALQRFFEQYLDYVERHLDAEAQHRHVRVGQRGHGRRRRTPSSTRSCSRTAAGSRSC